MPGSLIVVVLTVLSLGSLIRRYRRAARRPRAIAWVIYGAALAVVLSVLGAYPRRRQLRPVLEAAALVGGIAIAMFRYNLYDIGVVVNRTLVYGGLTAVLGGAYLVSVLLLQLLLSPSSATSRSRARRSRSRRSSGPARNRVQALVDRRFYRRKYDAQRTLEAFAARLRDEVALDAMEAELRGGRRRHRAAHARVPVGAAVNRARVGDGRPSCSSDIRGFTTLADRATSRYAAEYLREFFDLVVPSCAATTARSTRCSATGCWRSSARPTTRTARSRAGTAMIAEAVGAATGSASGSTPGSC